MIKLTNILDEIRVPPPGIPDLSDWDQNDIDGDPLTFDTPNGSIHAYRLSDTDEYHLDGYYRDGKDMIKQIAEFFDVPIKGEDKTFLTITTGISTVISTSQFNDLMNKAQVELDEIKTKNPQVDTLDPDVEDLIREYIDKEINDSALYTIEFNNKYFLDYLLNQTAYTNTYSVVARFIKLHMIANHYELEKNGQEMLVSLSNAKLVNKADMIDYINENIDLKRYLEKITWRYYINDVDKNREDIKDKVINNFTQYVDDPLEYIKASNIKDYTTLLGELTQHQFDDSVLTFPEETFSEPEFEEYLRQTLEKSEMLGENKVIKLLPLLKEYSDKTINDTIARWGIDPEDRRTVADAKAAIQRFDQIKNALSQRLDIAVIPDEIKNKDYKNIDLYSYEDILNLLRSLPESDEKIKKEAVRRFVEESGFDKNAVQSTVARFMTKKAALKLAIKDGLEDAGYSAEEVQNFIPKRLLKDDKYLDPRYWKWEEFERMMDVLFPSQMKVSSETGENAAETDADKVYNSGGLEIYLADDYHKCIKYNPVLPSGVQKYSWCVTKPGSGQGYYQGYRFGEQSPTFYFVVDRNLPSTPDQAKFDNKWHAFVIQVNADGDTYKVTSANNGDDTYMSSWDKVGTTPVGGQAMDPEVWSKLKGLKSYFKPVSLSPVERAQKMAQGKNLTVNEFKELPQDEKIEYVIGKASENKLKGDILALLPKYKIPYQGRTTTLANIAIDAGQRFTYNDLKEQEALAKRYAIFRFKHTNYGNEPIPLPFVQYLDDESKYKYYKTFDDNLTFDLIDKFFGSKIAKEYVDEQISKLSYLPSTAVKYMSPEQKTLYDLYSKLYTNWEERVSDEDTIDSSNVMPQQEVDPKYITVDEWQNLSSDDKQAIINLAEKYNGNNDYKILLYALPYMVKNNGKTYILLPIDGFKKWVMLDEAGRIVEDNIEGRTSFLKNTRLSNGYPTDGNLYRVYNADDVKINGNPMALKENIVKRMQQLAGLNEYKFINHGAAYYIQDWVKEWINQDYDIISDKLGEKTADAIYMFREIQRDDNNDYITDQEIDNWISKDPIWTEEDKNNVLKYLSKHNIIEPHDSINEYKVINPAIEQMLIDFIDQNYTEFRRLDDSEIAEYDINGFEEPAEDILKYLNSRPNGRFDHRGICIYWSDLYNTLSVENMDAEPDEDYFDPHEDERY
jgi:hypothetical protein